MSEEKRRHQRLEIHLPVQVQLNEEKALDLLVVDISSSGMRIKSHDFDGLKSGFDAPKNQGLFVILILARLAWAQGAQDGGFVTGWEFVLTKSEAERGVPLAEEKKGKRRHSRLPIDLTVRATVEQGAFQDIEMVDISPSGMQLRCPNLESIQKGMDTRTNLAQFRIQISARLAWVQKFGDDAFLTGWEFLTE